MNTIRHRASRSFVAATIAMTVLTSLPPTALAQRQPPPAQPGVPPAAQPRRPGGEEGRSANDEPVIRGYNLADLLRAPDDYPLDPSLLPTTPTGGQFGANAGAGGGGGGGGGLYGGSPGYQPYARGMYGAMGPGGGMPGAPSGGAGGDAAAGAPTAGPVPGRASPLTLESVMSLIQETVDPDSWTDNGGSVGRMRALGTSLIVTNTPAAHQRIDTLLAELRKSEGPSAMVSIDAYWVLLTPAELTALTKAAADPQAGMTIKYDAIDQSKTYGRARTLGFSGQTVHVLSGRARSFVTGVQPVVGTGAMGYDLQTRLMHGGVALQVTPRVVRAGNESYVVLDLWSVVSEISPQAGGQAGGFILLPGEASGGSGAGGPATQPATGVGGTVKVPAVDRPVVVAQQLRTTARIPVRKKVLLGGMTMEPTADGNDSGGRQLYLVVEANVDR